MFYVANHQQDNINVLFFEHLNKVSEKYDITTYTKISSVADNIILKELINTIPSDDIYVKYSSILITNKILRKHKWIITTDEYVNRIIPTYYIPISKIKELKQLLLKS